MVITGETMALSNSQPKGRNRTSRLRGKHEITLKKQETKKNKHYTGTENKEINARHIMLNLPCLRN